jgi:mannose-6-phosphate isomerase
VKIRRLAGRALEKVWGTPDTEPWYPRSGLKIGEVWFQAPEEPRLLLKFLFTSENLSVQVHPPDSTSGPGKTEMWYILRAAPSAGLALGFERAITPEEVRAAALSGEIEGLLRWYAAQPGDVFFVPAGTVHAIGPGLALCEIQQNSDVTYRLYDYGRPRELHLDLAVPLSDPGRHPGSSAPVDLGENCRLLVECPYFRTEWIRVIEDRHCASSGRAEFLACVEGEGDFDSEPFGPGQVWIAPADAESFTIHPRGHAVLLRTYVPEP